jgi:hypothetical protein
MQQSFKKITQKFSIFELKALLKYMHKCLFQISCQRRVQILLADLKISRDAGKMEKIVLRGSKRILIDI